MHIMPYDYYADRAVENVGLARTAALIARARAEAANSLLVDNGDFLQGNPMGDYIARDRGLRPGDVHPIIAAMNHLGYDGLTLGNHDFNYGLDFLMTALSGADFPVVSANVATKAGPTPRADATLVRPYVILDRRVTDGAGRAHPIRIGLIGFLPPQILQWDRHHLEGRVITRDILEAARGWLPQMREEGCDLIVALAHSGIGTARPTEGMENAAVPLAALPEVDALVTGHSHLVFPSATFAGVNGVEWQKGTIGGKPAVMAGFWGSHLGLIDLMLAREGGAWRVIDTMSEARPIERQAQKTPPAQGALEAVVEPTHRATLAYVRQPAGCTRTALHSYFAEVAHDPSLQIVRAAQRWHVARMLKGTAHMHLPLLSAAAPFKAGGRAGPGHYIDIPAGNIAIRNVADLYLYPNTIRAVKVTGADLKDWLERSAGLFNRITPGGQDQPLIDPDFPSYHFDVIDGITYAIDLAQPARFDSRGALLHPGASRIVDLRLGGRPVAAEAEFVIATNSYRAGGGGNFAGAVPENIVHAGTETNSDILLDYLAHHRPVTLDPEPGWRFAPMPGTTVLFDTGPGATDHLADVTGLDIAFAGAGPDGFARFRIAL